jgi:hypothetical protein
VTEDEEEDAAQEADEVAEEGGEEGEEATAEGEGSGKLSMADRLAKMKELRGRMVSSSLSLNLTTRLR